MPLVQRVRAAASVARSNEGPGRNWAAGCGLALLDAAARMATIDSFDNLVVRWPKRLGWQWRVQRGNTIRKHDRDRAAWTTTRLVVRRTTKRLSPRTTIQTSEPQSYWRSFGRARVRKPIVMLPSFSNTA